MFKGDNYTKLSISKTGISLMSFSLHSYSLFLDNTSSLIAIIEEAIGLIEHKISIKTIDEKFQQKTFFDKIFLDHIVKNFGPISSHEKNSYEVTPIVTGVGSFFDFYFKFSNTLSVEYLPISLEGLKKIKEALK